MESAQAQACGPSRSEWLGTSDSQTSHRQAAGPRLGAWLGETGPATPGMGYLETLTTSSSEPSEPIEGVHPALRPHLREVARAGRGAIPRVKSHHCLVAKRGQYSQSGEGGSKSQERQGCMWARV